MFSENTMIMDTPHEINASFDQEEGLGDMPSLHERLAAYALTVSGNVESRRGVWGEHSYARARGASTHGRVRSLLAPRAPSPPGDVDVESVSPPPTLPGDAPAPPDDDDDEDEWERRLVALAPSAAHVRLADEALAVLRDLRLERLACAGSDGSWARGEGARAAARRLRRALAPHWAGGGAAWLHAALTAQMPAAPRALYRELLRELRRAAPRLAARLPLARPLDALKDPLAQVPEAVSAEADGPWLVWCGSGSAAEDRRWTRRLGVRLHTRVLPAAAPPDSPERWAAAVGAAARAALERVAAEAAERRVPLALGGCGAGAALAVWLAHTHSPTPRLLLLAPPLVTAEGAASGRGAALLVRGGGAALERWPRARLLLLHAADESLRLPRRHRRRLRLPQHAIDAAVVEECARWLLQADERVEDAPRDKGPPVEDAPDEAPDPVPTRAIEIVEGRVMRVSGGTALTLRPRREPLAPADILQMPIVFADDGAVATRAGAPARPRGARRGARPRVLLAKRGRRV